MNRFRSFLVAALLLCWLPATSHCALDAATIGGVCCETPAQAADDHHADTHCSGWENRITQSADSAQVKAPACAACLCLLCVFAIEDGIDTGGPNVPGPRGDSPPLGLTTWQFEHRTALPPRAPSVA